MSTISDIYKKSNGKGWNWKKYSKKKIQNKEKLIIKKEDCNWIFAPLFYFIFIKIIPFLIFRQKK